MRGEIELLVLGVRLQPPGRLSENFRSRPGAGRSRVGGRGMKGGREPVFLPQRERQTSTDEES